jgi:3-oxoadipate enol-lactonase
MPMIQSGTCPINVQIDGNDSAPALILSNSLGTNLGMWDPQVPALTQHFRLVRYDRRGHGQSGAPAGPYTMEMLGRDVLAIMDGLSIKKANWCGLSMGGMVGQWLGANASDRFDRLVLCNTASYYADKSAWTDRIKTVKTGGVAAVAAGVANRWFTPGFIAREPDKVERLRQMVRETSLEGYLGCCDAIRDMDNRALLPRITAPTLVIAGTHDVATPPSEGEFIRARIPGARLAMLDAAHISNVEQAEKFTAEVLGFLNSN